ncbi:MAG TPA: SCO family protein [Moraxellaceae bacterium]|nr:SCO family protein [Moraxellaceae bacterium]
MSAPPLIASPDVARKNRRLLLILAASFIVPFLVGDLAYHFGWYQGGQTNHGRLINPPLALTSLGLHDPAGKAIAAGFTERHWWLLYVMPTNCDTACRNRLYQMRQVRRALGKEGERVRQVLVVTAPLTSGTEALLQKEFADFVRVTGEAPALDVALKTVTTAGAAAGELYVMDPMGWIMLAYSPEQDEKRSVVKAEDVLKDLQKLLKASQIG